MDNPALSFLTISCCLDEMNSKGKHQHLGSVSRVCFVVQRMSGGGTQKTLSVVCKRLLKEKNLKVDFMTLAYAGEMLPLIPEGVRLFTFDQGYFRKWRTLPRSSLSPMAADCPGLLRRVWVKVWCCGVKLWFFPNRERWEANQSYVFHAANYIDRHRPDIIVVPIGLAAALRLVFRGRKIARHKPKLICSCHSTASLGFKRVQEFLPEADLIQTVSKGLADGLVSRAGIDEKKVVTIYNPVSLGDISGLKQQKLSLPPWFAQKDGVKTIITAGQLKEVKDHGTLLRAFHILSKRREARLVILGEGEERESLERLARKLEIENRVFLPSYTDNPFAWFAESDVFVLSSTSEGFGNVLVEAMACGLSVVSTDCPHGPREILQDERFGKLVPVGSAEKLAAAIEETLDAPKNAEELINRAKDFSEDVIVPQYAKMFRDVLGAGA